MLLSHSQKDIDLQENWPIRFYESRDPLARLTALEARLSEAPDNTEEHKRREVLLQRFPELKNGKQPERDGFIAAWMMLLIVGRSGVNFLNRKKLKKTLRHSSMPSGFSTAAQILRFSPGNGKASLPSGSRPACRTAPTPPPPSACSI